jgi:hypothetical protein
VTRRSVFDNVAVGFAWRYVCHSIMIGLALWHEAQPAPSLPDRVLQVVPYVPAVARYNYHLWLLCYLPPALWLWRRNRAAVLHFLYVGGALSLLRGLCIPLTALGPVMGTDINAGLPPGTLWEAWLTLINPVAALMGDAPQVYLTKDLFFSGHTSTTFLLWLYCAREPGLRWAAGVGHVVVVASVFLSHLHYSIDVVGAWAITFSVFTLAARRWPIATQGAKECKKQPCTSPGPTE